MEPSLIIQMIVRGSQEWIDLVRNLELSKRKSNRDVLCLRCWKLMKYEESVRHKLIQTDHIRSVLTSKEFASEDKFVAVAKALGKC